MRPSLALLVNEARSWGLKGTGPTTLPTTLPTTEDLSSEVPIDHRPPPTSAAFSLVRKLLEDRPRHFQEILLDGVEGPSASTSTPPPAPPKSKAKSEPKVPQTFFKGPDHVPSGHPFVSGNFLKKRILPFLFSQNLITPVWNLPLQGSRLSRHGGRERRFVMWEINTESENGPALWHLFTSRDLSAAELAAEGLARERERADAEQARRMAQYASESAQRYKSDTWAWAVRPEGITTNLERLHLNRRRKANRTDKELARVEHENERAEAKRLAQEMLAKEEA